MSRSRFPRRIAGLKLGKGWRRRGDRLLAAARHPLVADLTAAALVALAGTLKERAHARRQPPSEAGSPRAPSATAARTARD